MTSKLIFKGFGIAGTFVLIGLVWITLSATLLFAQRTTGDILGRVTDESGGVIPGVQIEVTHSGSAAVRSSLTDDSGNYHISLLPVGTHTVTASLVGFKKEAVSNLVLNVDDRTRVDFVMKVGEISEQVEVTATAGLVKTDSADVGFIVHTEQLVNLPLNGRNFIQLNELSAGAVQNTGFRTTWYAFFGGNYSVNGSGPDGNNFLVDGIRNMGINDTRVSSRVNLDSVAEFKQQASLYSAEYGQGGGAQINLVTKSGTNSIHGSLFEFHRNSALDARNFFDRPREERKKQGLPEIPPFLQNQFGATIGGPIAKDRTFFFGQYEGLRLRKSFSRNFTVPTDAMRAGDFSGLAPIFDPLITDASGKRVQFPGNKIPAGRLNPVAVKTMERLYPHANQPGLASNYFESPKERNTFDQFAIKIDHQLSAENKIMGRYNFDDQRRFINGTFGRLELFSDVFNTRMQNSVIQLTTILNSTTVNEFRVGYSRMRQMIIPVEFGTPVNDQLGIEGTDPAFPGAPNISIAGFVATGGISNGPNNRAENSFTFTDNFSNTKGNHALGAGFDLRRHHTNGGIQFAPRGSFSFNSGYTSQAGVSGTGHSVASFMLGYPAVASRGIGNGFGNLRSASLGIYFKDDWKASPQLTFNLGLRWELFTPTTEATDRLTTFSTQLKRHVSAQEPDRGGLPRALYNADYNNFAPRFGLAWRPFSHNKTVIHAGYGVFYNMVVTGLAMVMRVNPPFVNKVQFFNDPLVPTFTLADSFSGAGSLNLSISSIDPNFRNGYNQQWILDVQQQLLSDLALTVGYIGNKGTKIQGGNTRNLNQSIPGTGSIESRRPYPNYSSISEYSNFGNSIYHALSVDLNKRMSRGFSTLVSYRWAHLIDVGGLSAWGFTSDALRRSSIDTQAERGNSTFDARHRLVWSYMWDLPIGPRRAIGSDLSGFTGMLLSGWQTNGIVTLQKGTPIDVSLPFDNSGTGCCSDRPDRVGNPNNGPRTPEQWFNTAAFVAPATPGTFGNAGRNVVTGPGIQTVDFSVFKSTRITESQTLQFRAEFFNLLNHPNFEPPGNAFGTASFGRISAAADSRQIQFGLKYLF